MPSVRRRSAATSESLGSVMSGGRYDELLGMFGGASEPAVGISLGVDRLFAGLLELGLVEADGNPTRVLVTVFDDSTRPASYALAGALSNSSETIAAMPALWRQCLRGEGRVDLRGCKVLSEDFFLWSTAALQSRVTSFFASRLLRGRVQKVTAAEYPEPLRSAQFRGQVYRLADLVLDVPSLVTTLAQRQPGAIFTVDWQRAALRRQGRQAVLELENCTLVPQQLLLTAGAGNASLLASLDSTRPAMQRRPLQQVLVRHQYQADFYGHCMGGNPSPRLTISSHRDYADRPVWYLGGDLSTDAADEDPDQLIERARRELAWRC